MKKMFAASLVAIMAVSAANAEIASVSYTNKAITEKTGDITTLTTTAKSNLTAAVNELAGKITETGSDATDAIDAAKTELQSSIDAVDDKADANAAAIEALDSTYATDTALNNGLALKQDKAKMLNTLDGFSGSKAEYYPTVDLMESSIATTNSAVMDMIDANTDGVADYIAADTALESSLKAYADQAESDAISAAGTAADGKIATALESYSTTTEMNTAIKNANDAQTTTITDAYKAADTSLETALKKYADDVAADASGEAGEVSEALDAYKTSNDAAVAAAKAAADAAQATADANTTAISNLGETYATDAELNTAKSDIKTAYEAADATTLSSAKTYAKEYADGLASNYATAAQGAKADSAVQKADVTTGTTNGTIKVQGQEVSVAGLGTAAYTASSDYATAAQGAKADTAMQESALKGLASWSSAGCATGTCSLVSKSGTIQWEAVRYAE